MNFSIGTCKTMCPNSEVHQRQQEKSFSRFETKCPDLPVSKSSSMTIYSTYYLMSKCHQNLRKRWQLRPIEEQLQEKRVLILNLYVNDYMLSKLLRSQIRPPDVLLQTVDHLLENILSLGTFENFVSLYSFIDDRLRCIRQDFAIQVDFNCFLL